MNLPLEKLESLERSLSNERGGFELFGVFLRAGSPERWDLIVAAPWLDPNERESLKLVADALSGSLVRDELLGISRIVILDKGDRLLESILATFNTEHACLELGRTVLAGIQIRRAFLITAKRRLATKRRRGRRVRPAG